MELRICFQKDKGFGALTCWRTGGANSRSISVSGTKTLNFLGLEWHYAAYPANMVAGNEVLVKFE
jgi:hypothetical protein